MGPIDIELGNDKADLPLAPIHKALPVHTIFNAKTAYKQTISSIRRNE